ncbi:MAG TPA: SDR family oxidoreductase [Candidatus Binataceae bacterium]|nr:SDR family oxidoreductase [Candidatus Binataceae bacterium]HVB80043.1 SDR family oxidoreductase [Candidatus Binataceae bacterium]
MLNRLEKKVAVVTGAGGGLGRIYCRRLAAEGADVAVWDLNGPGAEETARLVSETGRRGVGFKVDVTREEQVMSAAKATFDALGRIDILINNAGIVRDVPPVPIETLSLEDWNHIIAVNLTGAFLASKAVVPYMKRSGKGKIINVSSGTALHGGSIRLDYICSKAGVIGLTRALAVMLGPDWINVNVIAPGPVPYTLRDLDKGASPEEAEAKFPSEMIYAGRQLKREIQPADIDGLVAFLASPESDMITGQLITIDGGRVFVG